MKIIIFGPYGVLGGVATVVEELAITFAQKGFETTVISLESFSSTPKHELIKIICPQRSDRQSKIAKLTSICNPLFLSKLWNCLQYNEYDLAVSNLYYSVFLALVKAKQKVHILHGMGHYFLGWLRSNVGNYSNIIGAKFAKITIANSYLTAAINESIFGITSTVVPLGVTSPPQIKDIDLASIDRPIDVLYVGRLVAAKSIPVLLEAIAILKQRQRQKIELHILGDGAELNNLKYLAKQLNIEERAIFLGYVPREQLAQYYLQAKCLVSLNPTEPFGLTYLEALACGVPVILCRGSGFSSFADPRFTTLVDLESQAVAEAIEKTLNTEVDRNQISQHAIENFSWERTVAGILKTVYRTEEKLV